MKKFSPLFVISSLNYYSSFFLCIFIYVLYLITIFTKFEGEKYRSSLFFQLPLISIIFSLQIVCNFHSVGVCYLQLTCPVWSVRIHYCHKKKFWLLGPAICLSLPSHKPLKSFPTLHILFSCRVFSHL